MSRRTAVVTGLGLTTPLGIGFEENVRRLKNRETGIGYHPKENLPNAFQYFGKVRPFEFVDPIPPELAPQMKFLNRGALLGFAAAWEAIGRELPALSAVPASRRALYIASGDLTQIACEFLYPAMKEASSGNWLELDRERLNQATLSGVNPFFLLESIANNLFSFLSAFGRFMGPNTSLASLSPGGSQAVELAVRSIQEEKADMALAVGYGNWITEIPLYELQGLGLLSSCNSGERSFKPFDRSRDGFIAGEGGAAVLIEAKETAKERDARVWATIKGCGNATEFVTGRGLAVAERVCARSMRLAVEDAACDLSDLAFISAHGSATQAGDRSELLSILEVLDGRGAEVAICGMKPYTGHMGAASDVAELVWGIWALQNRLVPATLNFISTENDLSDIRVFSRHHPCDKAHFLSLSYGIGGQSSCLVLSVP